MKATELMINDLVQVDGVVRIATIRTGAVYDYMNKEYSIGCINPIPLTPKILEKNGLKYEKDYGAYYHSILGSHSKDNEPLICVQWNPQGEISQWEVSNKSGILTGVVAYGYTAIAVHELQHILRMVGLNEMADNFII